MLDTPLPTHEIGSLAKPPWRVKAMAGKRLTANDKEDAKHWGARLKIARREELFSLLENPAHFSREDKRTIQHFSSLYGIKFFESAGLDLVWDGEQHRIEMYEYPIQRIGGMEFQGHVRSFDNKYYRRAVCKDIPHCETPYHLEEFLAIAKIASRAIKIPITGAYTLADWSYDGHYLKDCTPGEADLHSRCKVAREQFIIDLANNVIHPNLKALVNAGARYLQIDEPAALTKRDEAGLFLRSISESIGDLAGKAFFSVHICYSHYPRLFPILDELAEVLDEIHLEYANRDSWQLGTTAKERTGYNILHNFRNRSFIAGIGVVDIHTDAIEPPELIRDRILYACEVLQDPQRIMIAPDCGLRTRTWKAAYQKLQNMVKGRDLALQALSLTPSSKGEKR
ncbi:MAG: hypothetical protein WB791_00530 [Waddliaceae bacterium]